MKTIMVSWLSSDHLWGSYTWGPETTPSPTKYCAYYVLPCISGLLLYLTVGLLNSVGVYVSYSERLVPAPLFTQLTGVSDSLHLSAILQVFHGQGTDVSQLAAHPFTENSDKFLQTSSGFR